jgi:hypothetical protein
VTWHPVPGTGLEPVWLPFCSKVQARGLRKFSPRLFRLRAEQSGIRNSNVTRHSNGASPSVWGRLNRSTASYTTGPLGPFGGPVSGHQGLRVNRHGFDPAPLCWRIRMWSGPVSISFPKAGFSFPPFAPSSPNSCPGAGNTKRDRPPAAPSLHQSMSASPHDRLGITTPPTGQADPPSQPLHPRPPAPEIPQPRPMVAPHRLLRHTQSPIRLPLHRNPRHQHPTLLLPRPRKVAPQTGLRLEVSPIPFSLHAADPQIPGWHALMRCKNNTLFSTWTA